ncbi:hypothetical protein BKK51_04575 [Rodentibacter trehalosifermentans]|uniref:Uncharacterized protein n=1 Tax=Rodentibacter trehalosifermentans TaxID=1908263 RepID=A0A1V3IUH2_9PAST|nr:hypothetical protein BKK51_04575 [Rodentibacter trehalosifermentans]OOF49820.1 hypothetical protein BKK52_02620 [Rodentibacter trehalosifermentans]
MKKIIFIFIFSAFAGIILMFIMFLLANVFYNINQGRCFYQIDLFSFFTETTVREIYFWIFVSAMYFIIIYLRYKDY